MPKLRATNNMIFQNLQRILSDQYAVSRWIMGIYFGIVGSGLIGVYKLLTELKGPRAWWWVFSLAIAQILATSLLSLVWYREHLLKSSTREAMKRSFQGIILPDRPRVFLTTMRLWSVAFAVAILFWVVMIGIASQKVGVGGNMMYFIFVLMLIIASLIHLIVYAWAKDKAFFVVMWGGLLIVLYSFFAEDIGNIPFANESKLPISVVGSALLACLYFGHRKDGSGKGGRRLGKKANR